jgi:hypothetical protein
MRGRPLVAGQQKVAPNASRHAAAAAVADLVEAPATVRASHTRDVRLDSVLGTAARADVGSGPARPDGRNAHNEPAAAGRIVPAADARSDCVQYRCPLLVRWLPPSFGGYDHAEGDDEHQGR